MAKKASKGAKKKAPKIRTAGPEAADCRRSEVAGQPDRQSEAVAQGLHRLIRRALTAQAD